MIDRGLQHLALRREPEAVVDQLGIARCQLVLQMRGAAIERQLLDAAVREVIDRAAGSLVHPAALHADEPVLDEVETADAVSTAIVVERRQQCGRAHALAVDRDAVAALEIDRDVFRRVGRVLGVHGARIDIVGDLVPRVLKHEAFARRVQHVRIGRERRLAALVLADRDLVLLGELDQLGAAGKIPFTPRRDDLDIGRQRVIAELEADLVVALAGRAVADRVGADHLGDLDLALGDQWPRDRGAEQVQPLVQRV